MVRKILFSASALAALAALASFPFAANAACSAKSGKTLVPLVELYTSEGCSSCPPADRWFSAQVKRTDANWLAFHVDYWDTLGWPDRFALVDSSARQRKRVNASGGNTVYTPQVMVGEQTRVSWNSSSAFESVLRGAQGAARIDLEMDLKRHEGEWNVTLDASESEVTGASAQVWLARSLDSQSTEVRAGENRGVTLRHDGIVRKLWGPWRPPVRETILVEDAADGNSDWGLVAFALDGDGRTLQSLAIRSDSCVDASH